MRTTCSHDTWVWLWLYTMSYPLSPWQQCKYTLTSCLESLLVPGGGKETVNNDNNSSHKLFFPKYTHTHKKHFTFQFSTFLSSCNVSKSLVLILGYSLLPFLIPFLKRVLVRICLREEQDRTSQINNPEIYRTKFIHSGENSNIYSMWQEKGHIQLDLEEDKR